MAAFPPLINEREQLGQLGEGRNGESREKRGMSGDWGQITDANHFLSLSHKVESGK